MPLLRTLSIFVLLVAVVAPVDAAPCPDTGIGIQILGSGGTHIGDNRASSGFLLRRDGRASTAFRPKPGHRSAI